MRKKPTKIIKTKKPTLRRVKKTLLKIRSKVTRKPLKKNKIKRFVKSIKTTLASVSQRILPQASASAEFELPTTYHQNKLVLLVRDPWWVYAYWEVTPEREKEVLRHILSKSLQKDKTVLRMYDITGTSMAAANSFFDIELNFFTNNWYVDVGRPNTDWLAELGIRTTDGQFFALVRSNAVKTPRFGISDVVDEEWMIPDELYWKLFGRMAGLSGQKSSLDIRESLERRLIQTLSSATLIRK